MLVFSKNNQRILVSVLLKNSNDDTLVIRAVDMQESINDTEYFNIPSWTVPFGMDPKEKIAVELEKLLEDSVTIGPIVSTQSYLQEGGITHVIEIIYQASTSKKGCRTVEECPSILFIRGDDVDAFILSSRLKQIIQEGY